MLRLQLVLVLISLVANACSPTMSGVDPTPPDLAPAVRDLGRDCTNPPSNRLQNPSFEMGDGMATNTPPPDTIPSWGGCCTGGTTTWTVSSMSTYCGGRAVKVASTNAQANVLLQAINSPGDMGKQFVVSGRVFVTAIGATGTIKLDIFDLMTSSVLTSTTALTTVSSDWVPLMQSASVPAGGRFQVRINSSGNVEAYVDDLSLIIQ